MKDSADKQTKDFLDAPRRGRPSTGKALTAAQRKAQQRQRDEEILWNDTKYGPDRFKQVTTTGLIEALSYCVKEGQPLNAANIAAELVERAKMK